MMNENDECHGSLFKTGSFNNEVKLRESAATIE
jgi:hypothetical protein